jgi:hypothetical protein
MLIRFQEEVMALYQDASEVKQKTAEYFDLIHNPGVLAPNAGIYICTGCGEEIGIAEGHRLPPQDHHTHPGNNPPIRWKLLVLAQHIAKS